LLARKKKKKANVLAKMEAEEDGVKDLLRELM